MERLIRIVIVDDHALVAHGLAATLRQADGFEVIGIAADCATAERLIVEHDPDAIACDVELAAGESGFDLLETLSPTMRSRVCFVSAHTSPALSAAAARRGAGGYVFKEASPERLTASLRAVAGGQSAYDLATLRSAEIAERAPSPREREVIAAVVAGCTNAEIAGRLGIGERTVETHLARLFARYQVASRTELATRARDAGWLLSGTR